MFCQFLKNFGFRIDLIYFFFICTSKSKCNHGPSNLTGRCPIQIQTILPFRTVEINPSNPSKGPSMLMLGKDSFRTLKSNLHRQDCTPRCSTPIHPVKRHRLSIRQSQSSIFIYILIRSISTQTFDYAIQTSP